MQEGSSINLFLPPRRCRKCYYILDHLESKICPECGEAFDPNDPRTYVTSPPFVWWTFWMPALLMAGVGGGVLWLVLIAAFGFTFATTLTVPVAIGVVVGYAAKTRAAAKIILVLMALGLAIGVLATGDFVGGFCATIVATIALVPAMLGALAGTILRRDLKRSKFSQRAYLKSIFLQVLVVFVPVIASIFEGRHAANLPVIVTTTQTINAPPDAAWHGIQFFEEVHRPTPWLLYLSPSLRPMYTIGRSERVGDLKTCVYQRGKLIKQITEVTPGKRLAFRVVEQDRIENDGATLLDGSFDLEPIDGGKHTQVRLSTRYIPMLNPRFAYQWAESLAIHTLHGHVLAGMKDKAEGIEQ